MGSSQQGRYAQTLKLGIPRLIVKTSLIVSVLNGVLKFMCIVSQMVEITEEQRNHGSGHVRIKIAFVLDEDEDEMQHRQGWMSRVTSTGIVLCK